MKITLSDGAEILYFKDFINESDSQKLFDELKEKVPWTVGVYNMFGKKVNTPRLLYAMRDKDIDITSSYKVTSSMVWTKLMSKLKDKITKKIGKPIIYAQLNYYRNGDDYIGYHTDKEVEKGDVIASISLGSERNFILKNIDDQTKHQMELSNGSLLVMNEQAAKTKYKHCLPKMKNVGERINITFRPK